MPLYLYFSFLLCIWLNFANALLSSFIFFFYLFPVPWICQYSMPLHYIFFFSFVSVSLFCQCSMPLCSYCFFLFFCVCGSVLPMFFDSLFFFFSFLLCLWLGSSNALCLFIYSLFLFFHLCLLLGFASVLCLFIYIFLFFCVFGSVLPMFYASF